ncbi:MAG TPA: alpha/beta hydrolase [Anaerolineales bacterium]|jgi:pimeloyl-ACP methyl ester carboxylesterase|nr:alpha/beta hydrolase [Anaerolineales bacterium]
MATFLFCLGGFTGGWWIRDSLIGPKLREAGHEVFSPTYTGLGERNHLTNPQIDLKTHIQDILMVLKYEDLYDVILVGYSYGGMVANAVVEEKPERIKHLVILDGLIPSDGQSIADIVGPVGMEIFVESVESHGDGWLIVPNWPGTNPRATSHPVATLYTKIQVGNPEATKIPKSYIFCTEGKENMPPIQYTVDQVPRIKSDPSWEYHEIQTDHNVTETDELMEILLEIGQRYS